MKKLIILLLAFVPFATLAQDGPFTINGKLGNLNKPSKIYLLYQLGANKVLDSSAVENGNFSFKGNVLYPVQATLVVDRAGAGIAKLDTSADHLGIYLEKAEIGINAADRLSKAAVTGSKINDDNKKLEARIAPVQNKVQALIAEYRAAPADKRNTPEYQNFLQGKLKVVQAEMETTLKTFINENPDSYLSLIALSSLGGPSADPGIVEPLFNGLSENVRKTEAAIQFKANIDQLKITGIGAMAPDFTQNDTHDIPFTLSSLRGKYVLIDFWASWCGPCRQENPNVVRAFNKYKAKNFTILGVSLDRDKAAWLNAIKADGLTWTQVSDLKYWNNAAAAMYFVTSIPQNYLIDPTGKIIAKNLRGEELDNKLAELFGKI